MLTVRNNKQFLGRLAALTVSVVPFALGSALLVAPREAGAEVVTYSTSKRTYKVGILLLESTIDPALPTRGPENPDPHLFYIADQRIDIKPTGWELDNPLAPATVTTEIFTRWSQANTDPALRGRDPGHPYTVGQKVTKDMAAYWEVYLSKASESELLEYDVLFITNHLLTSMTPRDREKLRKVVDAGGVIWLDDCGGMRLNPASRFFLEDLQFQGTIPGLNGAAGPALYQPTHPLLNSPYTMSYNDILTLGDKGYGNYFHATFAPNATGVNDVILTAPNKESLNTIIGNRAATDTQTNLAMPYISAGVYGSGSVIVTSADIGCGVNDYSGGVNAGAGGNSGAYSGKNLLAANIEDLKFLYNAIAWGGSNNTVRRNNRRTASSTAAVSAPLNPTFDFQGIAATELVNSKSAPLISQGILYVSGLTPGGNATIRAYDTVPNRDFDNDGNYDDGRPDLIFGTPYDEIWRWEGPVNAVQPSSPVLATVSEGGEARDVVLMTLGDGTLVSFQARPLDPATRRALATNPAVLINPPVDTMTSYVPLTVAPSPTFFSNKIYVVEGRGVVRCVTADPFTTAWVSTQVPGPYTPTGTPTFGLNRLVVNKVRDVNQPSRENTIAGNTNESTNDVMMYVPVQNTDGTSQILPYWLGARGEGTKDANLTGVTGTTATMRLRPASTNNDQYFISKGGNGFIDPLKTLRLYADVTFNKGLPNEITYTREENFAAGRAVWPIVDPFFYTLPNTYPMASPFTMTFQDAALNNAFYSGLLNIGYTGDQNVSNLNRVLAVADYDLVYVPLAPGGTPPPYLQTNAGHRNANPLTVRGGGGIDTISLAPNDLLLYGVNQTGMAGTFGALFAMQEREFSLSASRMRWRYLLHNVDQNVQVGSTPVAELPALRNRMIFNATNTVGTNPFDAVAGFRDPAIPYEALTGIRIIGSPITTNDGLTYILARADSVANNGTVTVLMAFQTVPQITLDLGVPLDPSSSVTVSQWDPLEGAVVSTSGDPNDRTRVDVDYKTGRLTIADFGALNNGSNLFSASSSFVVGYNQVTGGATRQQTKVFSPYGAIQALSPGATNQEEILNGATGTTTAGGFTPLLWYYVLPGIPQSSPTKIGDQIFLMVTNQIRNPDGSTRVVNEIVAVDADPTSNDPGVRVRSGEQVYGVVSTVVSTTGTRDLDRNHVRWHKEVLGGGNPGSPSGGEGVIAVNTNIGTSLFSEGLTVVAENTRILEVDASGAARLSIDGTTSQNTVGGASPYYLPDGSLDPAITTRGRVVVAAKSFRSPQSVRRLGSSEYLVADTGNNRVVRLDRSGVSRWSVEKINDPYGILAPGDPRTLNSPTDVLTRQLASFDATNTRVGFETHYLITDSGNGRIIDVVDYFDLDGRPRLVGNVGSQESSGVVVWTTRTKSRNGENLAYHNLQLIAGRDGALSGKPILVASVSNSSVAAGNNNESSNGSGGSLVQLDYNPFNTGFVLVDPGTGATQIRYYWTQALGTKDPYEPTTAAIAEPTNNGKVILAINDLRIIVGGAVQSIKRLNTPTYFEQLPLNLDADADAESVYLIVDADGVYACVVNQDAVTGQSYFDVLWQFTQTDYDRINNLRIPGASATAPLPRLSPSSVKRLANGNFLITNSYAGPSALFDSGQFRGEVFEVSLPRVHNGGTTVFNVNTTNGSVFNTVGTETIFDGFSVPAIKPVGALNKQQMGIDTNGAALTEQPRSADRL